MNQKYLYIRRNVKPRQKSDLMKSGKVFSSLEISL